MRRVNAHEAIRRGQKILRASPAIDHWQKGRERIESEELLDFVLGEEPGGEPVLSERDRRSFMELIERRASGEPVALITGSIEFLGLDVLAEAGVFIPRHSSEFLAIQAIRRLKGRKRPIHADIATGSGAVALAVANRVPRAGVYGTDVAADAVKLARRNAKRLGLKASFARGDLFGGLPDALEGSVDVITIHPPYVPVDEVEDLPDEVRAFEPRHTLTDGSVDGMELVRRTAEEGPAWLTRRGWVLVEADPDAARDVKRVLVRAGFRDVESTKGGELKVTRVVVARRPR
jgi:release factor glutamine methyltransferase